MADLIFIVKGIRGKGEPRRSKGGGGEEEIESSDKEKEKMAMRGLEGNRNVKGMINYEVVMR